MSQLANPTSRYSKRKRAQVNYYDGESEVEGQDSDTKDIVAYSPAKKRVRPVRPLPKHKIFPFLELPAEIRNMIYDLCLHEPAGIYLSSTTEKFRRTVERASEDDIQRVKRQSRYRNNDGQDDDDEDLVTQPLVPALLAVNQQMYREGRDILYSNSIRVLDPLALHSFMVNIGPRAAALVKDLTLCSWGGWRGMHKAYNHASFAAMMSATNIEKFKLDGWLMCKNNPKYVARQLYRDGFPWLEAVGSAKGSMEAAVNLIEIAKVNFEGRFWQRRDEINDHDSNMREFRLELTKLLEGYMKKIKAPKAKAGKKK
ncbi:hypothetical protein B0J11DRAFT_36896 [Dendryphion nanum]|uniref:DUF7730 domain-containing protein n=1 Tax=Dendryphion nanum TaxID=256645 RepID=A0A9P9EK75_9PLEO|nr:hypothetical protein B0J11DRAFT_36896 [Dendryphion nanum]